MMILTDKAKEDFYIWFVEGENNPSINTSWLFKRGYETITMALVTEWLDDVSIIIDINSEYYDGYHFWWEINISQAERSDSGFDTRQEALVSAIKRANEIYNLRP